VAENRRTLTRENLPELFEWIDGKAHWEPDGTVSGLAVFTLAGKVKAAFGDTIVRDSRGRFRVEHTPEVRALLGSGTPDVTARGES